MHRTFLILLSLWILSFTVVRAQDSSFAVITPENVEQLQQVGTLGRGFTVDVRYADNDTIETVSYGGLWRYDADNLNTPPQWVNIPQPDFNAQYSPDGRWFLAQSGALWDVEQQTIVNTFDTFSERAAFAQDSHLLAYYERTILPESDIECLQDNSCMQRVILWDTEAQAQQLVIIETDVINVELVNDSLLAVIQHEQTTFYDMATGNPAFIIPASLRTFSSDGTKAVAYYRAAEEFNAQLQIWDLGLQIVTLNLTFLAEEEIWKWQFNADGTLIAVSTVIFDENLTDVVGTIAVWDIAATNRAATFSHNEPSFGFAFSPDNRYLATINYPLYYTYGQPTITLFDLQTLRIQTAIPNDMWRSASTVAFRPDSNQLAISYSDGRLQTVDTRTGEITADIVGYGGYIVDVAFTDEAIMAINSEGKVFLFQQETLAPLGRYEGCSLLAYHEASDKALCFYYDGENPPEIHHLLTGELLAPLPKSEENRFVAATFRPDGQQFATISYYGTIQLWDANTGALQRILHESISDTINLSITYLDDGQYLAARKYGTIWDVETGEIVVQPTIDGAWHGEFTISETGNWFSQSIDNNLYIWRLSDLLNGQPTNVDTVLAILPSQLQRPNSDDSITLNYGVASASQDGRLLAIRSTDGFAVFDMATFSLVVDYLDDGDVNIHRDNLIRFSDDGKLLITGDGYCFSCGADESLHIGHARVWAVQG